MEMLRYALVSLFFLSSSLLAKDIQISIIKDGPAQKQFLSEQRVKQEINQLIGKEFSIRYTPHNRVRANGTIEGIKRVIEDNYSNPEVDLIIALGPISSNEISKKASYSKPTIAAVIIDPAAQNLPYADNRSNRHNFTYIADVKEAGEEILFFKNFVAKKRFAVLVEPLLWQSWPELSQLLDKAAKNYSIEFAKIAVEDSPSDVVKSIPENVDAVIVGPLAQYTAEDIKQLAEGLIKRKLPSYTFMGVEGVESGFLVTNNQFNQEQFQISRRIAINVQRILLGINAKDLPVNMRFNNRVVYNRGTGLAIGFAPQWSDIIDATIINDKQFDNRKAFNIKQAVEFALRNNIKLNAAAIDVELTNYDIDLAKSNLYPDLSFGASYQQINKKQVAPGINPEKRNDIQLNFSQKLYAEKAWANYDVSQLLNDNQNLIYQASQLDTIQATATAYLNLLRTKSNEEIRRLNLNVTRKNLELSENRLQVGITGKSDVLRWRSQLANDRQQVFLTEARRKNAELELARILNLPDGILVDVRQPDVSSLLSILTDHRFQKYVANEIQWKAFQEFYKQEAVKNSPELQSYQSLLSVNQRQLVANDRGHYIPDVNLTVQGARNTHQSGLGATDISPANSWKVGIQASLSFDLNGKRRTTSNKIKLEKKQLQLQRQNAVQQIHTMTGQALFNVGASYPSIELSRISAESASESLKLVSDAYAKGTVSISELLDAQNNALSAKLLAADSEYLFLQDYISLMRASGDFRPLLDGQYSTQWFDRLIKFFRQKGINVEVQ